MTRRDDGVRLRGGGAFAETVNDACLESKLQRVVGQDVV